MPYPDNFSGRAFDRHYGTGDTARPTRDALQKWCDDTRLELLREVERRWKASEFAEIAELDLATVRASVADALADAAGNAWEKLE
jgi:hypothetical protein